MNPCKVCRMTLDVTPKQIIVPGGATEERLICRYCGTDNTVEQPMITADKVLGDPFARNAAVKESVKRGKR